MISPRWPNTPLPKYPHLAGSDIPTWDAWIHRFGQHFTGFDYDIHVGQGLPASIDNPVAMATMWSALTQKRIDVVGYRSDSIWLIEVKDRPTLGAIGQALSYPILYRIDANPALPIIPCLISRVIEPDIETVAIHYGIRFYDLSDDHHFMTLPGGRNLFFVSPDPATPPTTPE